jgi:hypothetical protein
MFDGYVLPTGSQLNAAIRRNLSHGTQEGTGGLTLHLLTLTAIFLHGKPKKTQITCNMPRRGTLDKADVNLRTYFAGGSLYYHCWKAGCGISASSRHAISNTLGL